MKKYLTLCLLLCLLCTLLLPVAVFAQEDYGDSYPPWNVEDHMTDNVVCVTLHPEWRDKEYTPEDFAEVNCVAIEIFPSGVLRLILADRGVEYVYRAIDILSKREDVKLVQYEVWAIPPTGDSMLMSVAALLFSGTALAVLFLRRKKFS